MVYVTFVNRQFLSGKKFVYMTFKVPNAFVIGWETFNKLRRLTL